MNPRQLLTLFFLASAGCGGTSPTAPKPVSHSISVTITNEGQIAFLTLWLAEPSPASVLYSAPIEHGAVYRRIVDPAGFGSIHWHLVDMSNAVGCEVEGAQSTAESTLVVTFSCIEPPPA